MIRGQNLKGVWGKDSFMMPEAEQWGLAIKSDDFFMNQEVLRIFPLVQFFAFLPSCDKMKVVEFQAGIQNLLKVSLWIMVTL